MRTHEHPTALFTLVVRLAGRHDGAAAPALTWKDCATLDEPGSRSAEYFNPHIEALLLPRPGGDDPDARRWVCRPDDLHLELMRHGREPAGRARIDRLERLTLPLESDRSVGLIHLSLPADAVEDEEHLLWWNRGLSGFARAQGPSRYALRGDLDAVLQGKRPLRALVEQLFGDPADDLDRRLFVLAATTNPPSVVGEQAVGRNEAWRRALASGEEGDWSSPAKRQAGLAANVSLGGDQGIVVHATRAGYSRPGVLNAKAIHNLRSCWGDALLVGLLQHDRLEDLQADLARFGRTPATKDLADLHRRWLAFRNVVWWSQLSRTSAMPQRLLEALRAQLGTEEMFRELDGDFDAYVEHERQTRAEDQADALGRLQYYGAGLATTGTVATLCGGGVLSAAAAVGTGLAVGGFVRWRLDPAAR
jgi:hypothetical protein